MCDHRNKALAVLLSGKCWVRLTQTHFSWWEKSVNSSCSLCIHTVGARPLPLTVSVISAGFWSQSTKEIFQHSSHLAICIHCLSDIQAFGFSIYNCTQTKYRCGHLWLIYYVRVETILHMQSPLTEPYRCGHLWLWLIYIYMQACWDNLVLITTEGSGTDACPPCAIHHQAWTPNLQ